MKKTSKSIIAAGVMTVVAATWGLFPAAGHAMTVQDLDKSWGKPAVSVKAENGAEKRYYRYENTMDIGYRVFQIQGAEVIDMGLTGSAPKIEKAEKPGLPVSVLSREYWAKNPATIENFMGKPVSTRQLPDGAVEMFYKYAGTQDMGCRYFLVKDGKIIASGTTATPLSDPVEAVKIAPKTHYLSKVYYQNHPTSLANVEAAWGKPVQIKKFADGTEERLYKYAGTQNFGYRFFLIKDGMIVASGTQG